MHTGNRQLDALNFDTASLKSDIGPDGQADLIHADCQRLGLEARHQLKSPPPDTYVLKWRRPLLEIQRDSQRCESDTVSKLNSEDHLAVGDVERIRQDVGGLADELQSIEVGARVCPDFG